MTDLESPYRSFITSFIPSHPFFIHTVHTGGGGGGGGGAAAAVAESIGNALTADRQPTDSRQQ